MRAARITLAHLCLCAALVAGCGDSHGRDDLDSGVRSDPDAAFSHDAGHFVSDGAVGHDTGPLRSDAGVRATCDAQDAAARICPDALCDGPGTWHWNGDSCFWVDCGACEGDDCGSSWSSQSECALDHATCESALCRATSGTWKWWAEECGHYTCGQAPPIDCILGMPVCDCGDARRFDAERGCIAADCAEIDPLPADTLCASTGGSWTASCCHTTCGQPCAAACAATACDCGPAREFDVARGCIETSRCHERMRDETCEGDARCESGTICCQHCGGAGCFGSPTCEDPLCDTDEHTDTCGNRDDVP